ncbi:MAG: carboxypeptidase-like regulatory domain-containing protein [Ignavibacteriales bacterium]|nr:carboxypeptidase-like regulatory domain-containing protein [Ignavibacteriales bacterium]
MIESYMSVCRRFAYLLVVTLSINPLLFSQELRGTVVQKDTKAPLASVNVLFQGTKHGTITDSLGTFEIKNFPPGVYILNVQHVGYRKNQYIVTAERDEPIILMVELEIEPVPMQGMEVAGEAEKARRLATFDKRIITSEQIAHTGTKSLSTFLRMQYPGLFPSSVRNPRRDFEQLRFVLYLNGALVQYTADVLDTMIDIEQIDYIEVYRDIGMAPKRNRGSNERVIHIHTKLPEFRR